MAERPPTGSRPERHTAITRLPSLTGLRFLAALVVFGSHVVFRLPPSDTKTVLQLLFTQGRVGVSFFFILSGFVLAWSARDNDTIGNFYRRRIARILPAYLAALVAAVAVDIALTGNPGGVILNALPSVIGVQSWFPQPEIHFGGNLVGWSLSDEMFFYAVFPFLPPLLRSTRARLIAGAIALAAIFIVPIVLAPTGREDIGHWVIYVLPAQRFAEFVLGVALATAMRAGWRFPIRLLPATILAVLAYASVTKFFPFAFQLVAVTAIFFAILVAAAAQTDIDRRRSVFTSRPLVVLGEWSYAFYLTHLLVIMGVWWLGEQLGGREYTESTPLILASMAAALGIAIAVSAALYLGVERPAERRLRGGRPRPEMQAAE